MFFVNKKIFNSCTFTTKRNIHVHNRSSSSISINSIYSTSCRRSSIISSSSSSSSSASSSGSINNGFTWTVTVIIMTLIFAIDIVVCRETIISTTNDNNGTQQQQQHQQPQQQPQQQQQQFKEKPEWLQICKRSNPNEDNCFKKLFEDSFPSLAHGIPEVGIKNFEPLNINAVSVSRGSGSLVLSGGFQNLIVRGPSNATVVNAGLDLDKKYLNFDLTIPLLRINAEYNLKGNILLLPLVGNGDVVMALKNVRTSVYTKITTKNMPEEVIQIEEMKVTFLVGGMRIHLSNLFNGNEILGASLNSFLNQNSQEVISELRSDLEHGLAQIFKGLWNNVFSRMPLKLWLI